MGSKKISIFHSVVEQIDGLTVHEVPTGGLKDAHAIRVGRTIVLVDKNGRIYSSQVQGSYSYRTDDCGAGIRETIFGAARLGVISKRAMAEDVAYRRSQQEKVERERAAACIVDYANRLGIKLTAAQKSKIDAAKPQKAEV